MNDDSNLLFYRAIKNKKMKNCFSYFQIKCIFLMFLLGFSDVLYENAF